jgi:hypothetical protein
VGQQQPLTLVLLIEAAAAADIVLLTRVGVF